MNAQKPSELVWFKSSFSAGDGGQCLEAALAWRKSSYSDDQGGQCVEVAPCPATTHVRDSKQPPASGPTLAVPSAAWKAFVAFAAR